MKNKSNGKKIGAIVTALAMVFGIGGYMLMSTTASADDGNVTYESYVAQTGNVTSSVTGNGLLLTTDSHYMKTINGLMVTDVPVVEGDLLKEGDILASFDINTINQQVEYHQSIVNNPSSSAADVATHKELLEVALSYQEDPHIRSEVDGILSHYFLIEGVETGLDEEEMSKRISENESLVADISTNGVTKMTIAVDEKDITKVTAGQETMLTIDAFPTEVFPATVTGKLYTADTSSSVSTYAVDLEFENDDRFLAGMNGSASINVASKENVVLIPVNAIVENAEGTFVYTSPGKLEDGSDKVLTPIETGISDGVLVEVISGVNDGDMIIQTIVGEDTSAVSMFMGGREMAGAAGGVNPNE